MNPEKFKHVSFLWEDDKAAAMAGNEVDLLIYRSNLLGADLRLTNYAGGNTSVKIMETDPVTAEPAPVMWVKGSGGDLGTLRRKGCANLYLDRLRALKKRYRGLEFEDEMVALFNHCLFDPKCAAPSIDTPLHGLLPFRHIDHLHPDAVIAIAASKNGEHLMRDIWGQELAWVDWQRPGFDLGLKMEKTVAENPGIKGIILGGHGLFTWADDAYACYVNTLEVIEKASVYLNDHIGKHKPVFGGIKLTAPPDAARRKQVAAQLMPALRAYTGGLGHFSDDERVLEFVNANDLQRLAAMGTSCPDHFLRTKIRPLVLPPDAIARPEMLEDLFEQYRADYRAYYERCKHPNSPAIRDANPVVVLCPGIGMFTFAKNKATARIAAEFYTNAINVMRGAESVSEYLGLPEQESFDIEYWLLEEAKLQRMPAPKPLSGKVALVTGSGGGIGKAIASKLAAEGACVVLSDIHESRLAETLQSFQQTFGPDAVAAVSLDVTKPESVSAAFEQIALLFGGLDIAVNNAGISLSKPLESHSVEDWDMLYDILVKGQFLVSQTAAAMMQQQQSGGDIINIVSKNALVAGPNNAGYGSAKAAQAHLSRLLAAELGHAQIRVNTINPDAVIAGSNIWAGGWAEGRAKAYGISVEELPAYYAKRTLLNQVILPEDIANACFALVGGLLSKSTGNMLNVDGGVPMAFSR